MFNKNMHYRQAISCFLILFSLLWITQGGLVAAPAKDMPGVIRVMKIIGNVKAIDSKKDLVAKLSTGDTLTQGYIIETDVESSAVLLFGNGSTIFVDQSTRLNITEFIQEPYKADVNYLNQLQAEPSVSNTSLYLDRGKIIGSVKKLNIRRGSSFDMESSVGIAGIRGTRFEYAVDNALSGYPMGSFTVIDGQGFLIPLQGDDEDYLYLVEDGRTIISDFSQQTNLLTSASDDIVKNIDTITNTATDTFSDIPAQDFEPGSGEASFASGLEPNSPPEQETDLSTGDNATGGDGTTSSGSPTGTTTSDTTNLTPEDQVQEGDTTGTGDNFEAASDSSGDIDPALLENTDPGVLDDTGTVAPSPSPVTPAGGTP